MDEQTPVTVLVSHMFTSSHLGTLRSAFPDVVFVPLPADGSVPEEGKGAHVLLRGAMTKDDLRRIVEAVPGLRWIHTSTAGFDWVLIPEVDVEKTAITRSAGSYSIPIGEFTVGLIFALSKRFPALFDAQRERRWEPPLPEELGGATVGIVGAGAIGSEIAWRAAALGMRVIGTKRQPTSVRHFDQVLASSELPVVLQQSDFLILACPLTPETRHMMGENEFRLMKKSGFLINIARGALVQEEALLRALREGWIAGAAMDAFEEEPLPQDHPYWEAPNFIVTPHMSYRSVRNTDRIIDEFMDNLSRFLAGEPLKNGLKHPELGY